MTSTWTTLASPIAAGQLISSDFLTDVVDNLDFLRNPPSSTYAPALGASTITTSSASFVDLTGFSVTVVTQGNPVLILFMARVNTTNARFDFLVDGVSITGDNDALGAASPVSTFCAVTIARLVSLSAGSHTIKVQWRSTSGTITLYPAGLCQLHVREL